MIETMNRAFMYGESVFTTMRLKDGSLQDWDLHLDRLKRGVEFVYGPFTEGEEWSMQFQTRLEAKCALETGDKVIRVTVYREQARGLLRSGFISAADLRIHLSATPFEAVRLEG